MLVRSSASNIFNTSDSYNKMLTRSNTEKASLTGGCREMTSGLHHYSGKSDVQCPSQCPDRSAVERVNRELIVAKLTALLTVTALMCLNIHSFWSHTIRSSTLSIGSETIVLRACDIPAHTGWFFQRIWPALRDCYRNSCPQSSFFRSQSTVLSYSIH